MNAPANQLTHSAGAGRPIIYVALVGLIALTWVLTYFFLFVTPSHPRGDVPVAVTSSPGSSFHALAPAIPPPDAPITAEASSASNVTPPIPAPVPVMPPSPPKAELGEAVRNPQATPQTNQGQDAPTP